MKRSDKISKLAAAMRGAAANISDLSKGDPGSTGAEHQVWKETLFTRVLVAAGFGRYQCVINASVPIRRRCDELLLKVLTLNTGLPWALKNTCDELEVVVSDTVKGALTKMNLQRKVLRSKLEALAGFLTSAMF